MRGDVEDAAVVAERRVGQGVRHVDADAAEEADRVARPAHGDRGGGEQVLEQQVPADEPREERPEGGVGVGVGGARDRDHRGELGVADGGERGGDAREHERDHDRRPGVLRGGGAGGDEDAGADHARDAERGEAERAHCAAVEPLRSRFACTRIVSSRSRHGSGSSDRSEAARCRIAPPECDFVARERALTAREAGAAVSPRIGPATRSSATTASPRCARPTTRSPPGRRRRRRVRVAGRLMLIRRHGGLVFAELKRPDRRRSSCSSRATRRAGSTACATWTAATGSASAGTLMRTRRGELSLRVREWRLLSKSLRALPDKHRGLTDVDTRLRERYLDLIVNPELAADLRHPLGGDRLGAPHAGRARLHRGRDAGARRLGGRRRGAPVHHPPQRARHRHVPADRARAAAQAARGRRLRARVRDRPRVPQRGPRHPPQPRVHAARGLPGARATTTT